MSTHDKPKQTEKQRERQGHRKDNGQYEKVNPCYVCGKSAGVDYYSHPDTDRTIGDDLICLCKSCMKKCEHLEGKEAVKLMYGCGK